MKFVKSISWIFKSNWKCVFCYAYFFFRCRICLENKSYPTNVFKKGLSTLYTSLDKCIKFYDGILLCIIEYKVYIIVTIYREKKIIIYLCIKIYPFMYPLKVIVLSLFIIFFKVKIIVFFGIKGFWYRINIH